MCEIFWGQKTQGKQWAEMLLVSCTLDTTVGKPSCLSSDSWDKSHSTWGLLCTEGELNWWKKPIPMGCWNQIAACCTSGHLLVVWNKTNGTARSCWRWGLQHTSISWACWDCSRRLKRCRLHPGQLKPRQDTSTQLLHCSITNCCLKEGLLLCGCPDTHQSKTNWGKYPKWWKWKQKVIMEVEVAFGWLVQPTSLHAQFTRG